MKLIAFALVVLISSLSFAQMRKIDPLRDPWDYEGALRAKARADWRHHYPGTLFYPEKTTDLIKLVETNPACGFDKQNLSRLLDDYYKIAKGNRTGDLQKKYTQIRTYVDGFKVKGPDCYHAAMSNYAIGSFSITLLAQVGETKFRYWQITDPYKNYAVGLGYIAAALLNKKHIQWLTQDLRNELGGTWTHQIKEDRHKILGAYQCHNSKALIDNDLPPIDLAGVLVHELDHLFRDKMFDGDGLGLRANLLLDETLATLHGAYVQRAMDYIHTTAEFGFLAQGKYYDAKHLGKRPESSTLPFTVDFDSSLFRRDGPFEYLWRFADYFRGYPNFNFNFFTSLTFLTKESHQTLAGEIRRKNRFRNQAIFDQIVAGVPQRITEVYQTVHKAYFKADVPQPLLSALEPNRVTIDASPLTNMIDSDQDWAAKNQKVWRMIPGNGFDHVWHHKLEYGAYRVFFVFQALEMLLPKMTSSTPMCDEFIQASKAGLLDDYLGNEIGSKVGGEGGKTGGEGGKTGGEGGKTGGEGGKTGGEGGKTGGEGGKTGGEGGKTEIPVRPCVHNNI